MIGVATALVEELPPRARRILQPTAVRADTAGTTSACAENTVKSDCVISKTCELPPRARRIRGFNAVPLILLGTTSACAENTNARFFAEWILRNYLRVRGEYLASCAKSLVSLELPPRARRIP